MLKIQNYHTKKKIDKTLKNKLSTHKLYRNEFIEILIEHFKLYKVEGLVLPKRFEKETKKFIKNNAPMDEWFESCVIKTGNNKDCVKASVLYANFIEFMETDNVSVSQMSFKNTLCAQGIQHKRKMTGYHYFGIQLKEHIEDDVDVNAM